ncbi:MAG: pyridoxamine 5'-phosphate oxidase family protein [Acidimicrobiales bacterium]|jgi:general stress protein 26|nr:pyridoxamine 5'-phosphate oxidase family protein [Acidimicrobiales bacterium]
MAVLLPQETTAALNAFVSEKHLGILTLVRKNGRPHSTPVGFMWDDEKKVVKIITWSGSLKTRLLEKASLVGTISQVDGGRWVTFEGSCSATSDSDICSDAVERYSLRYSRPKDRGDERRTITMIVDRILLSAGLAS